MPTNSAALRYVKLELLMIVLFAAWNMDSAIPALGFCEYLYRLRRQCRRWKMRFRCTRPSAPGDNELERRPFSSSLRLLMQWRKTRVSVS
jgi:hypothetical protein